MPLDLRTGTPKNIFKHGSKFAQGLGKIRIGAEVLVANDGSGDFSDIQGAIDSLPSTGGTIYIKEGIYEIKEQVTISTSNVQLIGEGFGSVLYTTKTDFNYTTTFGMIYINAATNTHFFNLRFKGTAGALAGQNLLYLNAATYTIIDNCKFNPARGYAIMCKTNTNCQRGKIINCEISSIVSQAVSIKGNEWLVQGNVFFSNAGNDLVLQDTSRSSVSNNLFIDGNITLEKLSDATDYNIVSNNIVKHTTAGPEIYVLTLRDCERTIVIGNILENTTGDGILIDADCLDTLVTGNIIKVYDTAITDSGTDTLPNGATGTTNLAFDDLNIIA